MSRADFVSKMGIVEEECDEAVYWIEVILELGFVAEKRTKELLQGS
jgi:four helix bundle protein